ncbi:MAG: hydrogenase maturation protease [Candidatus Eisenbacteria bacterium]
MIGFGSPMRSDDGVGLAAIEELKRRGYERPGVDLVDGGVRGVNLLAMLEGYDRAIVLDAALARKGAVGDVQVVDLEEARFLLRPRVSLHNLDLGTTFELARALDIDLPPVEFVLMGVSEIGPGEGLSPEVQAALPGMVEAAARRINGFSNRIGRADAAM